MEATEHNLLDLLDLQKIDSRIDVLEHRKRNLKEQAELDALNEKLAICEKQLGERRAVFDEISMRQKKLDLDIEMLRAKLDSEQQKVASGNVASARELAGLHAQIDSLKRRIASQEDLDLEVMEEKEQAEKELQTVEAEAAELAEAVAAAAAARDDASAQIDVELEQARGERMEWAPKIPSDLLEFYDDLREGHNGIGAAALEGDTCLGCHMKLPAQEVARIRKERGLQRCEECRRILVVV